MNKKINKKLLSDFSAGIGLLMFLLLPLKNVYADGRDHSFENLAAISAILMIAVASIIFASIFAKDKDLLVKVIMFCATLLLLFCLLFCFIAYSIMGFDILFDIKFIIMSLIILAMTVIIARISKKKEK